MPRETYAAFSDVVWDDLCSALEEADESAAVLLAGVANAEDRLVYMVNQVLWVPGDCYVERTPTRLKVTSRGWMPALKAAAGSGLHPIFFHTHPHGDARPSTLDDAVDAALAISFSLRAGVDTYASMILGGDPEMPTFSGRVAGPAGTPTPIRQARVVGRQIRIVRNATRSTAIAAQQEIHQRQVLAFGKAGQEVLAGLKVGVVGAGGTGSAVIEQLARLGVRQIVAVDDDCLAKSNISRVYGSSVEQTDMPKVRVAAENVRRIGLDTELIPINGRVTDRTSLEVLRDCDVVFGCTDDHAGRINLSRLAFWYLIPVIDVGVQIDSDGSDIRSITGRVTYVAPGEACLICRGTVNQSLAREEQLDPAERRRLADEGYARGLEEPDPSVVAYTTMVAAAGVADLLERLYGFGEANISGELIMRIADRKIKGRRANAQEGHFCADRKIWGRGDQTQFLGQAVWA